jgi:hypothetical protein
VFGSRLGNDRKILGKGNWNLISKDPESIYFKTVRGQRFLKFRHRLIR